MGTKNGLIQRQLLDDVDNILPACRDQWDMFAVQCFNNEKKWIRNGESYKNKFDKLAFMKKPTGTTETPLSAFA